MSDISVNFTVSPIDSTITVPSNEISFTPTPIDMSIELAAPGPGNLTFDVEPVVSNLVVTTNDITFSPTSFNMSMYAGGLGVPGGSTGTIQYNNGGQLNGIPNVTYVSGNLNLGNVANVKLTGGNANSILKTDGNGNLSWGNPAIGGSNTQVQYNSNGSAAGSSTFTFNNTSNTVSIRNVTVGNAYIGNYYWSNGSPLNLSNTYANSNVLSYLDSLPNAANEKYLTVDGSGALSWAYAKGPSWSDPSTIPVGTTFTGLVNDIHSTGNTLTATATATSGRDAFYPIYETSSVYGFCNDGSYIYACMGSSIVRSPNGQIWTTVYTASVNFNNVVYNGTHYVATGASGRIAYSSNGTSWTIFTLGTASRKVIVFGTTFVAAGTNGIYTATSANISTWTQRNSTANLIDIAATSTTVVAITSSTAIYSTTPTSTWNNSSASFTGAVKISSSTSTFVVSPSGTTGTHYTSSTGNVWSALVDTTGGFILYDSVDNLWRQQTIVLAGGTSYARYSSDLVNWSTKDTIYLGRGEVVGGIIELYKVSDITLYVPYQSAPTVRKLAYNLIYVDTITMVTAPAGSYRCLGALDFADRTLSYYLWIRIS